VDTTNITGDYITETISVGSAQVKGLRIGLAKEADLPGSAALQGIIGVGLEALESSFQISAGNASDLYPNFVARLVQDGLINTPAYSIWLNDLR
jgi:hypothetical protein